MRAGRRPPGERRHLAAERFRRIWELVETIALHPGKSRVDLAREFGLSERQLQDDLNVIRREMAMALVRRHGYRFLTEATETQGFSLAEAQLLLLALRRAALDPGLPGSRLRALMQKMPALFPLHLRPLIARTMVAADAEESPETRQVFNALADALLRKTFVQLHYPAGRAVAAIQDPIVQPEVLLPYQRSWYVVGLCRQRHRVMVFDLDAVTAVTQASDL